jgi:transaldolase
MDVDGGDADAVLARISAAGVDIDLLAVTLQKEGAEAFVKSWHHLLDGIAGKARQLAEKSKGPALK